MFIYNKDRVLVLLCRELTMLRVATRRDEMSRKMLVFAVNILQVSRYAS